MPSRSQFKTAMEYNAWFRDYWKTRRKKQRQYMKAYRRKHLSTASREA